MMPHARGIRLTLLLSVAACGGASQLTPIGLVPAGITVDLLERNYVVAGDNAQEMGRSMRSNGPVSGGRRFSAVNSWRLSYQYRFGRSRANRCELSDVRITLNVRVTMPEWERPTTAPAELVTDWEDYERALRLHEEGHRDWAIRGARELLSRLRSFKTETCVFMEREVRSLADGIIERFSRQNRDYDEETGHGRTQGAVWPVGGGASTAPDRESVPSPTAPRRLAPGVARPPRR